MVGMGGVRRNTVGVRLSSSVEKLVPPVGSYYVNPEGAQSRVSTQKRSIDALMRLVLG